MTTVLDELRRKFGSAKVLPPQQCSVAWSLISKIQRRHGFFERDEFLIETNVVWQGLQLTCWMSRHKDCSGFCSLAAYGDAQAFFQLLWKDGNRTLS
jgi:hypothetical protein